MVYNELMRLVQDSTMIINLSKDYARIATVLGKLYNEPVMMFPGPKAWTYPLSEKNNGEHIKRLTIIGHGESVYDDEQSMFGGNINEKIMMTEEFAHSLTTLLKYNERENPGFCAYLKAIDILDFHKSERTFKSREIAEYLYSDTYLQENVSHLKINSFVNPIHPKLGTRLMPHTTDKETISFYTFDTAEAFTSYKNIQTLYDDIKAQLHHVEQMPGHSFASAGIANTDDTIDALKKECDDLMAKGKKILREKAHRVHHIVDPRKYLDKHSECRTVLSDVPKHGATHHANPFEKEKRANHKKPTPKIKPVKKTKS